MYVIHAKRERNFTWLALMERERTVAATAPTWIFRTAENSCSTTSWLKYWIEVPLSIVLVNFSPCVGFRYACMHARTLKN